MGIGNKSLHDLYPDVIDALQGRTDVSEETSAKYLAKAILEITESYPFEQLRVTGPNVQLTIGQPIYPHTLFLNPGDELTQIPVLAIYVDFPGNTVTSVMAYKTSTAIETMISPATQGLPSRWTRFGNNIHIGPNPNQTYTMFARYQRKHPFPQQTDQLPAAPVYLPDSWMEIAVYGAAERIAVVKRWNDQATYLHNILYGDPEFQMSDGRRGRPGLIAARTFQQERDEQFSVRQLIPRVARYNVR